MIHQIRLTNFAWLKKPASASQLKVHELIALCSAALRPRRETWDRFIRHLQALRDSGAVNSDEAAAVLASGFTDRWLSDIEEQDDVEADTLTEVVERVKDTYREQISAQLESADRDRASAVERRRQLELAVLARADSIGRLAARVTVGGGLILVAVGLVLSLPGVFDLWRSSSFGDPRRSATGLSARQPV
jgi:hypothetical protein